jgi:uncharacterized protein
MSNHNKEYINQALEVCKKENIFERLKEQGKPLFIMLSGAHNFGFPSKDSDFDIRGVYYAPSSEFFKISPKIKKVFETMSEDRVTDVSIDELSHYLKLVSTSNGNRIEWPFSDLILYESEDFKELKSKIQENAISKDIFNHYQHFARDMWQGKTKAEGIKKDLYALRVYMTGITILEEGLVCSDITKLNQRFNQPLINTMIKEKYESEMSSSKKYCQEELKNLVQYLDERLISAHETSKLPEKPNLDEINNYLQNFRMKKL